MSRTTVSIHCADKNALNDIVRGMVECDVEIETFENTDAFLSSLPKTRVNALVIVADTPPRDEETTLKLCRAHRPDLPVVMIVSSPRVADVVRAMRAGAVDVLETPVCFSELCASLHHAMTPLHAVAGEVEAVQLTPREGQILRLLVEGNPNKVIAHELGISPRTVEVHRSRMMKRIGVRSFAELVRFALQNTEIKI